MPILGKRPKFDNSQMKEIFDFEPRDIENKNLLKNYLKLC